MVLDQVKHRYMLETPVLASSHYSISPLAVACIVFTGFRLTTLGVDLIGVMHNLAGRVNQQVTPPLYVSSTVPTRRQPLNFAYAFALSANPSESSSDKMPVNKGGTSETARDARFKKSNFSFREYNKVKPEQIKKLDTNFLIWFIGFLEGDRSFSARDSNKVVATSFRFKPVSQRGEFEITQSSENRPLLFKIRSNLGFGRVFDFEKEGRSYSRFYTSEQKNIIRLLFLLNGNLVLERRREQFKDWLLHLKTAWNLDIVHKESQSTVSLTDPWLSGFADADAGFYTNVKTNFCGDSRPSGGHYVRFACKFYITQKGEKHVLEEIARLVGANNKIYTLTNGKTVTQYYRVEIYKKECVEKLVQYFSSFPLKGIRRIDCLRWARVFAYKMQKRSSNLVGAEKLARLLENLQDPGEDILLKDYINAFTPEEWEVLESMPRRHV